MKNKLLLHTCCAPCSPNIISSLKPEFEITPLWFNPNIYPEQEYGNRLSALKQYLSELQLPLIINNDYTAGQWIEHIENNNITAEPDRCRFCYQLRLKKTVELADSTGFTHFSTTLLSSPYQKHDLIKQTGELLEKEYSIKFVYTDMRKDYFKGKDIIRLKKLYLQKYCGCKYTVKGK